MDVAGGGRGGGEKGDERGRKGGEKREKGRSKIRYRLRLGRRTEAQSLWSGLRLVGWLTVRSLARSFVRQRAAARVC